MQSVACFTAPAQSSKKNKKKKSESVVLVEVMQLAEKKLMKSVTACTRSWDTSSTLTFVWSSRQAFQGNQRTVICLLIFHTEGKKVDWWAIYDCREKKRRKKMD